MGQLMDMAATIVAMRASEMNGSGVIASCRMKILPISNETQVRWTTWLPVSLLWEVTDLGSHVSLSIRENPTVAPSSDPIIRLWGQLSQYPLLAEIYAMQSSLACISWTIMAGETSQGLMSKYQLRGLNPVFDSIGIGDESFYV